MHIGNSSISPASAGSTHFVLACWRNSASWFHLALPSFSKREERIIIPYSPFSCQPAFYIALSHLPQVSRRLLIYWISPSKGTIFCLQLPLLPFSVSSLVFLSHFDTRWPAIHAACKKETNLGLFQWHSTAFPAALGCFKALLSIYLFRLLQGNEQMFLLSNLQQLYDLFAER